MDARSLGVDGLMELVSMLETRLAMSIERELVGEIMARKLKGELEVMKDLELSMDQRRVDEVIALCDEWKKRAQEAEKELCATKIQWGEYTEEMQNDVIALREAIEAQKFHIDCQTKNSNRIIRGLEDEKGALAVLKEQLEKEMMVMEAQV